MNRKNSMLDFDVPVSMFGSPLVCRYKMAVFRANLMAEFLDQMGKFGWFQRLSSTRCTSPKQRSQTF